MLTAEQMTVVARRLDATLVAVIATTYVELACMASSNITLTICRIEATGAAMTTAVEVAVVDTVIATMTGEIVVAMADAVMTTAHHALTATPRVATTGTGESAVVVAATVVTSVRLADLLQRVLATMPVLRVSLRQLAATTVNHAVTTRQ